MLTGSQEGHREEGRTKTPEGIQHEMPAPSTRDQGFLKERGHVVMDAEAEADTVKTDVQAER